MRSGDGSPGPRYHTERKPRRHEEDINTDIGTMTKYFNVCYFFYLVNIIYILFKNTCYAIPDVQQSS